MSRALRHAWIHWIMAFTGWMPDFTPILRLRGWLVSFGLQRCGRDFQVAGGVTLNFPGNICIGDNVYLARGCWLHASGGITLEDQVQFGPYVVVITGDHALRDGSYRYAVGERGPVTVGRGAWVAAHATVLRNVSIGAGALVAANAVVTRDVPAMSIVGGVPARLLKEAEA